MKKIKSLFLFLIFLLFIGCATPSIVVDAALMIDYAKWIETLPVHESVDIWTTDKLSIIRKDVLVRMPSMTMAGLSNLFTPLMIFEEVFLDEGRGGRRHLRVSSHRETETNTPN
jgi:hypothetical protein